jgi:hypothetical protein
MNKMHEYDPVISGFLNNPLYVLSFVIVIFLLAKPSICQSQIPGIHIGDRIRVSIAEWKTTGKVTGLTEKSLVMVSNRIIHNIPYVNISRLEVARGSKSNLVKGILIGTGGGAVLGGLIGLATYDPPQRDSCTILDLSGCLSMESEGLAFFAGVFVGGVIGCVSGTIIGITTKSYSWQRIPVKATITLVPVDNRNMTYRPVISLRWPLNK